MSYSRAVHLPGRTIASNDNATTLDVVILCNAIGGAITVTLPSAVTNLNKLLIVKKIDSSANAVTVAGSGGQTIDGQASLSVVNQYDAFNVWSDGSNWYIIL